MIILFLYACRISKKNLEFSITIFLLTVLQFTILTEMGDIYEQIT